MNNDRFAERREEELRVWDWFGVKYVYRIAYVPPDPTLSALGFESGSLKLVSALYARNGKAVSWRKLQSLYMRMLNDPKLRSEALLALFPDDPFSVKEARKLAETAKYADRSPGLLITYAIVVACLLYPSLVCILR